MKILQSSVFRAICSIAIGCLLIKYPDNTVIWITVAIGILFLLSGIISLIVYINARKNVSEYRILDAEGRVIAGEKPTFPIVGLGSLILGCLLALTPNVFITALMYIIGGILILGAINQYMNLINARRYGKIGFGFWAFPSIILLIGLYVMVMPMSPASTAMLILGWCSLLYGVTELVNSLKFHAEKRKFKQYQEIAEAEEIAEKPSTAQEVKEEEPSDNTQLSVPTRTAGHTIEPQLSAFEYERHRLTHFWRQYTKLAAGNLCGQLSCCDDTFTKWKAPQNLVQIRLLHNFQVFIRSCTRGATDTGGRIEEGDTLFPQERNQQIKTEAFPGCIHKIILIVEEEQSHDSPHIIDKVRIIESHRPPFLRWRKGAKHQQSGIFWKKRLKRMSLYFHHFFISSLTSCEKPWI